MPISEKGLNARVTHGAGQSSTRPARPAFRWIGERGLLLATGTTTLARYALLRALALPEVEDLVPADGSLLVVLKVGADPSSSLFEALTLDGEAAATKPGRLHDIAVVYDGEDLPDLARHARCSVSEFIRLHSAAVYTVAFVGFQPGFAYLEGLPRRLAAPRRAVPRTRVPAGSVAIGGHYCGVYPTTGPGGWQLVGHTRVEFFDPARSPPAYFAPGDRVRFIAK